MKTAVVTGANSGIGKVIARALLKAGMHVIIVARNETKGQQTLDELAKEYPGAKITLLLADLSSVKEVKSLAGEIKRWNPVVDILVNNAGAIHPKYEETVDGYERTFATNHLAYFQLGNELLDCLRKSDDGRMVNLASEAQWMGKLRWDEILRPGKYSAFQSYCNSKLMNIMFSYSLAERLKGTRVKVNAMHPGVVRTSFGRTMSGGTGIVFQSFGWMMRSPEKGADTAIWLATSEEAGKYSGKYFKDRKPIRSIALSYRKEAQEKLWDFSEKCISEKL